MADKPCKDAANWRTYSLPEPKEKPVKLISAGYWLHELCKRNDVNYVQDIIERAKSNAREFGAQEERQKCLEICRKASASYKVGSTYHTIFKEAAKEIEKGGKNDTITDTAG